MAEREPIESYFMKLALHVATRATCPRKNVGCVITNKYNHVIATGYNGVPKGYTHCTKVDCGRHIKENSPCMATHAEQNALLQCRDVMGIKTIYCTLAPCLTCAKLIANTSCKYFYYNETYKDKTGLKLLESLGIKTQQIIV